MAIVKKIWRHIEPYTVISKGYIKSFAREKASDNHCDVIDFVVTWVDGSDPDWMEQKTKYSEQIGGTPRGNGKCRYRNWECFKYWFRAVEKYAPWVHNVYLVTWGHVPEWLNIECPKLKIINHTDFMPADYLPTFNCNPLELNLHRIPGLSELFVYFNDDVLLNRPCEPTDFFINGKPLLTAVAYPMMCRENQTPFHIFFGTIVQGKFFIWSSIQPYGGSHV